jgi:thymidylate synthase (FAD)
MALNEVKYEWTAKITAELQYSSGSDIDIARAAWVSTKGERAQDEESSDRVEGLLSFLMREHHGTPFEHNSLTFLVRAPIFVWREHMRHRIGWSYNEESARYNVLAPKFYLAKESRVRVGKPGRYHYERGSDTQDNAMDVATHIANRAAYQQYLVMLDAGIAPEVARMVLPVNIYSSAYVTTNVRGMLHFLELREASTALLEIRQLAHIYDAVFAKLFPLAHKLYHNWNVAP